MSFELLSDHHLRNRIQSYVAISKKIYVVSAYVTTPAVNWLLSLKKLSGCKVSFIARLSPDDLFSGSSDFESLRLILSHGWELRVVHNLHAKIFLFDESKMIVGSGNWTANGLKLAGEGNVEAALDVTPDAASIKFVNELEQKASIISAEILNAMELYVKSLGDNKSSAVATWPDDVVPVNNSLLLVSDFPYGRPGEFIELYEANPLLPFAQIESSHNCKDKESLLIASKAVQWLMKTINASEGRQMYFGELSSKLHTALADDPAPYRRQVKDLLAYLLLYIQEYLTSCVNVSRPNYSQLIKLL